MTRDCLVAKSMKGRNCLFPVTNRRKRRESVPHLQNLFCGSVRVPFPDLQLGTPGRCVSRRSDCSQPDGSAPRRYRTRPCKLTPDREAAIRALAVTWSLRALAAEFGVSHETVRSVLRATARATGPCPVRSLQSPFAGTAAIACLEPLVPSS